MTIKIGDKLPEVNFVTATQDGPVKSDYNSLFAGKTVALFAVPGAFTPTCSVKHLPSYVADYDALKAKGIDDVICMAVNDAFVMKAWQKDQNAENITMLADGNGDFAKALGLEMDGSKFGMGLRSQRFALIAKDGVVTNLFVEAPGEYKVSSADYVLSQI